MAESADLSPVESTQKPRILVADDSKLVRKTADKILSPKFDLVLVEDGEQAWQALTSDDSIQVVFSDIGMPNLDGYGLIERIRQSENVRIRDLPVIIITGAAEEESVRRKVFELGATDFVGKPFKSTEIVARAEAHASYHQDKEKVEESIDIDLLTGALNGKGLRAKLAKDVSFINRHRQNLALVIFELDDFKIIAEKINKQAFETIIKHIAKVLGSAIRKEDSFGRSGVAKFVIILPMAKPEGVIQLSKRLCAIVKSSKLNVGGERILLTLSVGIAAVRKGGQARAEDILLSAEQALANAKSVGKGEVQFLKIEGKQKRKTPVDISVDSFLDAIAHGQAENALENMDAVLARLAPLIALMSEQQKQELLK